MRRGEWKHGEVRKPGPASRDRSSGGAGGTLEDRNGATGGGVPSRKCCDTVVSLEYVARRGPQAQNRKPRD